MRGEDVDKGMSMCARRNASVVHVRWNWHVVCQLGTCCGSYDISGVDHAVQEMVLARDVMWIVWCGKGLQTGCIWARNVVW